MAQLDEDYVVADGSGSAVLADINAILTAVRSTNKGTGNPSHLFTGMLYIDDTTATAWTLKMYDGGTGITIGKFDTSGNTFYLAGAAAAYAPGSRDITNIYQNGYCMRLVNCTITPTGGDVSVALKIGSANPPTTTVGTPLIHSTYQHAVSFLVPPIYYYQVVKVSGAGTPATSNWTEVSF